MLLYKRINGRCVGLNYGPQTRIVDLIGEKPGKDCWGEEDTLIEKQNRAEEEYLSKAEAPIDWEAWEAEWEYRHYGP